MQTTYCHLSGKDVLIKAGYQIAHTQKVEWLFLEQNADQSIEGMSTIVGNTFENQSFQLLYQDEEAHLKCYHLEKNSYCSCHNFEELHFCEHLSAIIFAANQELSFFTHLIYDNGTVEKLTDLEQAAAITPTTQLLDTQMQLSISPIIFLRKHHDNQLDVVIGGKHGPDLFITYLDIETIFPTSLETISTNQHSVLKKNIVLSNSFKQLTRLFKMNPDLIQKRPNESQPTYFMKLFDCSFFLKYAASLGDVSIYYLGDQQPISLESTTLPSQQLVTVASADQPAQLFYDLPSRLEDQKKGYISIMLTTTKGKKVTQPFKISDGLLTCYSEDHCELIEWQTRQEVLAYPTLTEQDLPQLYDDHLQLPAVLSKKLLKKFFSSQMISEVVVEKHGDSWDVSLFFIYGDVRINACTRERTGTNPFPYPFIDFKKEEICLNWFDLIMEDSFRPYYYDSGRLNLTEPKLILKFLKNSLPKLTKHGIKVQLDRGLQLTKRQSLAIKLAVSRSDEGLLAYTLSNKSSLSIKELAELQSQYRPNKRYLVLENGAIFDTQVKKTKKSLDILQTLGDQLVAFDTHEHVVLPNYRAFGLSKESKQLVTIDQHVQAMLTALEHPQATPLNLPAHLKNILRPYQLMGVYWMQQLKKFQLGGVLADDMGLGKTLQVIAYLTTFTWDQPILIVTPKTLIYNWQLEFAKFAPELPIHLIDGSPAERLNKLQRVPSTGIIITSYPSLIRDYSFYPEKLSHIIIDEAQFIKNPQTKSAKVLSTLCATYRFAISGTPFENNLMEVWSLYHFLLPGFLGTQAQFKQQVYTPVHKEQNTTVLHQFKHKLRYLVLRRLKEEVLPELPPKISLTRYCEMESDQQKLYDTFLAAAKQDVQAELASQGFNKGRMKILAILTRLRQICNHPSLFLENYQGTSAKFELLLDVITEALENGRKILIFSQFTSMLSLIETRLKRKQLPYFYLSGTTKGPQRLKMATAFNQPDAKERLFLLSLKAGGTGLNLTGADLVIHVDPWWNPSVENQATDRAHRIGQTKSVQVTQLIVKNTIEEKIQLLKEKKGELFNELFNEQTQTLEQFSEAELKQLLEID